MENWKTEEAVDVGGNANDIKLIQLSYINTALTDRPTDVLTVSLHTLPSFSKFADFPFSECQYQK